MSNEPTFTYLGSNIDDENNVNDMNSDDEQQRDDYENNSNIEDNDDDDNEDEDDDDDDIELSNEDNIHQLENLFNTKTSGDYLLNNPIFKSNNENNFINSIGGVGEYSNENMDIDSDDDDEYDENYLQKFDEDVRNNIIQNFHPETNVHNYQEVKAMCKVVRNPDGIIIDDLHKTVPFLTKYEKSCIIGQRAKQINSGAKPFVTVPKNIIDGDLIALMELNAKKIPFIIRRPIPDGFCEYWYVNDLELI